jgi:hypothetical protein
MASSGATNFAPMHSISDRPISDIVQELHRYLGSCVLLPCKGKRPIGKAWQRLTLADMTPAYLAKLTGHNIGISLGAASDGLVSIDLDTDEGMQAMLAANPGMQTFQTKGSRGGNLWLRIKGTLPPSTKLKDSTGRPAGEWRSTGNQTIVHGCHPVTLQPYQVIRSIEAQYLCADDLKWPLEARPVAWPGCDIEDKDPQEGREDIEFTGSSLSLSASTSLCHTHGDALAVIEAERQFQHRHSEGVARLYNRLVERRYAPKEEARNDFIVNAVPFLYRALHENLVVDFSMHFFRMNQLLFKDSESDHLRETQAALKGVAVTYLESLPPDLAQVYSHLEPLHQAAFRIARDLASHKEKAEFPPPLLILPVQHLADRLGLRHKETSRRILDSFRRLRFMEVHEAGASRTMGKQGRSTVYRWLLP